MKFVWSDIDVYIIFCHPACDRDWTNLSAHLNRDAILNIGFNVAQRYIGLFRLRRVKVWLLSACPTVQRLRIELYHDCQQNCKVIVESMASMTLLGTFCHIRTLAEHLHPDALVSLISLENYLISHLALRHVRMAHRHPSVTTLCFFGSLWIYLLGSYWHLAQIEPLTQVVGKRMFRSWTLGSAKVGGHVGHP